MSTIHHLNCGTLHVPPQPVAICHCLLLEDPDGLVLIDTGIGLQDVRDPIARIGQTLIDVAGFKFDEADTAVRRIERLGFNPAAVTDVVLTHCDPDHTGGLADFPRARVHVSAEERAAVENRNIRYLPSHFAHGVRWALYAPSSTQKWFGLEARRVMLSIDAEVLLIPLFGHTAGHCGVAIRDGDRWLLHAGDAYYLRPELTSDDHPVSQLATRNAVDDVRRRATLDLDQTLARAHGGEIEMFGYHDASEFPAVEDAKSE
jgi:glyoxylase-like metal-dependent hydrolase (beta-lactamase superfamily II)